MEDVDSEDIVVVIIGDEDEEDGKCDTPVPQPILNIKQEVYDTKEEKIDDPDEMNVEELIETAEKYGETLDLDLGYLKREPIDNYEEEYYIQDFSDEDSEDCVFKVRKRQRFNPTFSNGKEQLRHKMRSPEEQVSFVKELREQHPELKEDTELLIDILARIMLDTKRPDPPQDYFIMNDIMFECVECGATSDSMPAASRHWQEKHGPRYLVCFACGVDFRSTTNLYKHEKRCNAPDAVIVLKARARTLGRKGKSRPFLVTASSIREVKQQTAKKRFPCSYCSADFSSKQSALSHEYKHTGARPYRCTLCPAAYTSACGLSRHSIKHTDIQYICDHCERPFKCKSALIVHLDTHKPLRKYPCSECGKRFAQKMALQLHVDRVHRCLPPPCACQICPKRYPRMSLLKTHMLKEHGMNIITRKMFYKSLPMLTQTQLQQAKVVLKSELEDRDTARLRAKNSDTEYILQEGSGNLTDELMQYIKNMNNGQLETDSKYIVIQNGEAICVNGANIDFYKSQLINEVEQELEQHLEYDVPIVEDSKADVRKQIEALRGNDEAGKMYNSLSQDGVLCETSGVVIRR